MSRARDAPLVEFEGVNKYFGEAHVLKDIDREIDEIGRASCRERVSAPV